MSCQTLLLLLASMVAIMMTGLHTEAVELTIGTDDWYSNNDEIQRQSMQLADKFRNIVFSSTSQRQEEDRPPFTCEANLDTCFPLLIQQNYGGSNFFNRSWNEFKVGFNDTRGNYWLGNELLHVLTRNVNYKVRFDLQATTGAWYWAEYTTFVVLSEDAKYHLYLGGYSSNSGYDALSSVAGMMFTTYDRDNDMHAGNCASINGGGFWYKACSMCNINNTPLRGEDYRWYTLKLRTTRVWLLCK